MSHNAVNRIPDVNAERWVVAKLSIEFTSEHRRPDPEQPKEMRIDTSWASYSLDNLVMLLP
jgi:hypothetical protein